MSEPELRSRLPPCRNCAFAGDHAAHSRASGRSIRCPSAPAADGPGSPAGRPRRTRVATTVVLLGLVSMLTDVSSEMVVAVLPIFLIAGLGVSPLAFGVIDGLYQGATALMRLVAGYVADRWRSPKAVAVAGYGISAASKLLLVPATTAAAAGAAVFVDRVGKGVRTGPRDALIAEAAGPDNLGASFGVHRAFDTAGALAGPIIAFAVLAFLSGGAVVTDGTFRAVFTISSIFAIAGVAVLVVAVPAASRQAATRAVRLRDTVALLRLPRLRHLILAAGALGLVTVSDSFLYLTVVERGGFDESWFPLLFVGTAVTYLLLAVPAGRLADRIGRIRVWLGGYVLLIAAYVTVLLPGTTVPAIVLACGLLGAYYAGSDGVLAAATAPLLPGELRSSGMALMQTVVAISRFLASVLFGLVWTVSSPGTAVVVFGVGLAIVLTGCAWSFRRGGPRPVAS